MIKPIVPKRSKYSSIPTEVDGHRFASRKEARRYSELKLMEQGGIIEGLELQPKFPLVVNGEKIGTYIGDFRYRVDGEDRVEDVKGVLTPVYRLKKKLVRALYGVVIVET